MPLDMIKLRALQPPNGLPFKIRRLGHVVLQVADLGRSLLFAVALAYGCYTQHAWEDFYITYRASKNLATGHGLTYTIGERVLVFLANQFLAEHRLQHLRRGSSVDVDRSRTGRPRRPRPVAILSPLGVHHRRQGSRHVHERRDPDCTTGRAGLPRSGRRLGAAVRA